MNDSASVLLGNSHAEFKKLLPKPSFKPEDDMDLVDSERVGVGPNLVDLALFIISP
jgi:hypothetical protein|tara:strand:- start:234 stop:401 length:168 start_codon:yes stop_codon:yes gene_type:complete